MAKRRKRTPKPSKKLLGILEMRKRRTAIRKGNMEFQKFIEDKAGPRQVDKGYLMRFKHGKGRKWLVKAKGFSPGRYRCNKLQAIIRYQRKHNIIFKPNSIQLFKGCFNSDADALFQITCIEVWG